MADILRLLMNEEYEKGLNCGFDTRQIDELRKNFEEKYTAEKDISYQNDFFEELQEIIYNSNENAYRLGFKTAIELLKQIKLL